MSFKSYLQEKLLDERREREEIFINKIVEFLATKIENNIKNHPDKTELFELIDKNIYEIGSTVRVAGDALTTELEGKIIDELKRLLNVKEIKLTLNGNRTKLINYSVKV
jgi:hypothetical protein